MPRSSTLTLIIPRLHEQPPVDNFGRGSTADSILGLIAGRGQLRQKWTARNADEARLECWQRGLIQSLGLDEHHYPSAPVAALSIDGSWSSCEFSDWLHAEPVHLSAGMSEVSLVPLQPSFQLTEQERDALTPAIRAHVVDEGFELRANGKGWLIGSQHPLKVSTVCIDYAMRNEWGDVLPRGDDAGRARRLMTELQMLLHEHPVNEARVARGIPVVNSLWLWGNGRVAPNRHLSAPATCIGNDEYLRGICNANGWANVSGEYSATTLIDHTLSTGTTLSVLNNLTAHEVESDWLVPIAAALKQGQFARLEIVLDEWQLTIDRWQLQKFWRRTVPFRSWVRT
jgi:hypothetical protein